MLWFLNSLHSVITERIHAFQNIHDKKKKKLLYLSVIENCTASNEYHYTQVDRLFLTIAIGCLTIMI